MIAAGLDRDGETLGAHKHAAPQWDDLSDL